VWAFSTALYGQQPQEGTPGLPDAKIAEIAVRAGVPQDMADSFTKRTFEPWVAALNESAGKAGVTGTPTITITGEVFPVMCHARAMTQVVRGLSNGTVGGVSGESRRVTATGRSDGASPAGTLAGA
jgi:protein-disulfide isomerase